MRSATVSRRAVLAAALLATAGCRVAPASGPGAGSTSELVWGVSPSDRGPAEHIAALWNDPPANLTVRPPAGSRVRVVANLPDSADDRNRLLALELNVGICRSDILDLDVIWTAEFAQNGWLTDLSELHPDINQVSLAGPVQTAVWAGKLWATPYTTDAGILYHDRNLVPEPPTTWEELTDVGLEAGRRKGIAPFVADGAQYEGLVVQYLEYFWGDGGEFFDAEGRLALDPKPAMKAAEFMQNSFHNGFYAPDFKTMNFNDSIERFRAGQAVFMRSWPYAYKVINDSPDSPLSDSLGIVALPSFKGFPSVAALGGHNLAVNKFSNNTLAAAEFVRFVSTEPMVQEILATEYFLAPTLRQTYADLTAERGRYPLLELLDTVLETARPRPATPQWTTISEEMQQQIFAAYTGDDKPPLNVEELRKFIVATVQDR